MATVNGHCSGTATGHYKSKGICVSTTTCNTYKGSYINGGCPSDPNDIKCCLIGLEESISTNPCSGASYCEWANLSCSGSVLSGRSCHMASLSTFFSSSKIICILLATLANWSAHSQVRVLGKPTTSAASSELDGSDDIGQPIVGIKPVHVMTTIKMYYNADVI